MGRVYSNKTKISDNDGVISIPRKRKKQEEKELLRDIEEELQYRENTSY